MILAKKSIQKLLKKKVLKIDPEAVVAEASVNIHLSSKFSKSGGVFASVRKYILKPKEFILALSKEKITMPENYAGLYDGYTHLARKGIITHLGSMFIHPLSEGQIVLEIFNASNQKVSLEEGMRVGQVLILEIR